MSGRRRHRVAPKNEDVTSAPQGSIPADSPEKRAALSRTTGLRRRRIFAPGAVDHDPAVRRLWGDKIRSSQKIQGGSTVQRLRLACAALIGAALACVAAAQAQDYPNRPIRVFVGFGPGSGADITARVVGARMSQILGQQIVVENKAGAGSSLAAEAAARAPKDGYTLLMATISQPINAAVVPNLPFDFVKDFAPIALVSTTPNLLVVHPSIGVKSVKELIALAKEKPDSLSFGSSGVATGTHLSAELFKVLTGVKMVHVPYGGSAQAVTDLLAGRIQLLFSPASTVIQHVHDGKLVALAATEAKRAAIAPEVPTMAEAGLPGFETGLWFGLLAPAGTPREAIDKISAAANEALKADEVAKALHPQGIDLLGGTPADFARYIDSEMKRWDQVARAAGLKK
jgi:tripartite-type tricarboxylate transporter receptor subunit TctC